LTVILQQSTQSMTIDEILLLPTEQAIERLKVSPDLPDYETEIAPQYDTSGHDVFDTTLRPYKSVTRSTGSVDATGRDITETVAEDVNRIAVPFQQLIVNRSAGFLLGNPVTRENNAETPAQELLADMVERTLTDNKEPYFNRKVARTVMSECQAAELWYLVEDPIFWRKTLATTRSIFKLRVKLLSPSAGDKLYPYFDEYGDMVAFSRGYVMKDDDGREVEHLDTWTETAWITRQRQGGKPWEEQRQANVMGKIPVVYYQQAKPEWGEVQSMIERYETKASNFADTNDYFGSPMVKITGQVLSLPGKTTQGKVIQLDVGGDAQYMAWSQAPESERLEFEMLERLIYSCTQTPNISFEQMKAMGSNLSGFAIKLMFTDAHMKAENKIELFGEMFQRRYNLLKHVLGSLVNISLAPEVFNLEIEPVFTPYLPRNEKEDIEVLSIARGNRELMSRKTALENNPLVASVDREIERMDADRETEISTSRQELIGTFNL
jgi:SPP1 family phage portal protein